MDNSSAVIVLTSERLEICLQSAGDVIAPAVTATSYGVDEILHLDGSVILDVLVYKTLIPILVAAANALVLRQITAQPKKDQSLSEMRAALRKLVGQSMRCPSRLNKSRW